MFMTTENDSTILAALLGLGFVSARLQGGIHAQVKPKIMYLFLPRSHTLLKLMMLVILDSQSLVMPLAEFHTRSTMIRQGRLSPTRMASVRIVVYSGDTTITVDIPMKTKIVERPNSAAIPPKRAHR
ncbi:hypothetical protein LRAMOSA09435 [Lichtheimia ramosa]|uniref:Uncharacterized protein n=1 Tax=Lichtheimia ramosa TaxID=688394 RepID=A0A077WK08_9FUNG|nr:hypothetical protein LRAMOSA09435 [Lichtheimia ramosa]